MLATDARSATCFTGTSHGDLLSDHKRDQAWPGTPEDTEALNLDDTADAEDSEDAEHAEETTTHKTQTGKQ